MLIGIMLVGIKETGGDRMIFSAEKPAEIRILRTQDDLKKGTCKVRYAFRFAIQEPTQTEITYSEVPSEISLGE
jgi:hypothetical protein